MKFILDINRCMKTTTLTVLLPLLCVACANTPDAKSVVESDTSVSQTEDARQTQVENNSINMNQIASASTDFDAPQISKSVDAEQLTVQQLKAYADRCGPEKTVVDNDIDCSELSLRVRKVFRSDDKIQEALITLDRLGRSETEKEAADELGRNTGDLSYAAQAIANGVLNGEVPELPEEPVADDLEKFLNENGLGVNAGAIITTPGG